MHLFISYKSSCHNICHCLHLLDIPINNERFCSLKFRVTTTTSTVHGFAGFFDAVLYNQINISMFLIMCVMYIIFVLVY